MRMNRIRTMTKMIAAAGTVALLGTSLVLGPAPAQAQSPLAPGGGVPQIPAFLPNKYSVPATQPTPIDGVWVISSIGKRVHIERGRTWAVDPWVHMFVLRIQPDMVVGKNLVRLGPGRYVADDLPLMGKAQIHLNPDGNLSVNVQGALGPAAFTLIRQAPDHPAALDAEIAAMTRGPQPAPPGASPYPPPVASPYPPPGAGPAPPPGGNSLTNCKNLGVSPQTGDVVCMD